MLLEVKNLGIAYGDKPPIVQGVTFNLDEGEILASTEFDIPVQEENSEEEVESLEGENPLVGDEGLSVDGDEEGENDE